MSRDLTPICPTVEHLLIDCVNLENWHVRFGLPSNLGELLENVDINILHLLLIVLSIMYYFEWCCMILVVGIRTLNK